MNDEVIKTGSIDRLVGDDALVLALERSELEIQGDNTSTLKQLNSVSDAGQGCMYEITALAESKSAFQGYKVGEYYYSPKGVEKLSEGDKCIPMIERVMADAKSLSLSITASEIDVTVMDDTVKKYRSGKGDATGTLAFQVMISELKQGSIYNKFFKIVRVKSNGKQVMNDVSSAPLFIKGYLQKQGHGETQVFVFAQIELFGITLGADMGAAQEYTSNLRIIGINPVLYVVETLKPEEELNNVIITPDEVVDAMTETGIQFTATPNITNGVTYKWTGTNINFGGDDTSQTVTATPQTAAECTVTVTVTKDGQEATDTVTFTATEKLKSVTIDGTATVQINTPLTLTARPNTEDNVSYTWTSETEGASFDFTNKKVAKITFTKGSSGVVKVVVKKGKITQEATKSITITGG